METDSHERCLSPATIQQKNVSSGCVHTCVCVCMWVYRHGYLCAPGVCVCMCLCVCMCVCVCTGMGICVLQVYACARVRTHVCTGMCVSVGIHAQMSLCAGLCVCEYVRVCVCDFPSQSQASFPMLSVCHWLSTLAQGTLGTDLFSRPAGWFCVRPGSWPPADS